MWMHPVDTKEPADALSIARGHAGSVQCVYCAVNKPAGDKSNRDPHTATALNVDTDPIHARGSGRGVNVTKSPRKAVRLIEKAEQ